MIIGIWLFGFLADHFARWKIFLIYQIGSFIMVAQYAQLQDPTALLICGAIMGLFVNGMIGGYGALISDNFPRMCVQLLRMYYLIWAVALAD